MSSLLPSNALSLYKNAPSVTATGDISSLKEFLKKISTLDKVQLNFIVNELLRSAIDNPEVVKEIFLWLEEKTPEAILLNEALIEAIERNKPEIALQILEKGAFLQDTLGQAFEWAVALDNTEIMEKIMPILCSKLQEHYKSYLINRKLEDATIKKEWTKFKLLLREITDNSWDENANKRATHQIPNNALIKQEIEINALFSHAVHFNNWNLIRYLLNNEKPNSSHVSQCLAKAADAKQWDIVEQIYRMKSDNKLSRENLRCNLRSETLKKSPIINSLKNSLSPEYYDKLIAKFPNPLLQAKALLNDYTKGNSRMARFFHGNWNRHHISAVTAIIRRLDSNNSDGIKTKKELLDALKRIKLTNKLGTLAGIIDFVENKIKDEPICDVTEQARPCNLR